MDGMRARGRDQERSGQHYQRHKKPKTGGMDFKGQKGPNRERSGWIRQLKNKQEAKAKYNHDLNSSLASSNSVKNGPIDTVIVGDSIIKYIDKVRHTSVISFPGIACGQLEQLIVRNKVRQLEGKKVILIHAGTNDLDNNWRTTVHIISKLLVSISDKYPTAKIVWSNILPRPACTTHYDKEEIRQNIIKINREMKRRQRHLKIIPCPSHTSFHTAKYPITKLFAMDFLHLKPTGTFLLRELYRQHLLRLRNLWKMETWKVQDIPDPETIIDRNWLTALCNNRTSRFH